MDSLGELAIVNRFLTQCAEDRERGNLLPLTEYLKMFPGHDAALAREYAALLAEEVPAHPQRIGNYLLRQELGRGGQATVYLAHDERLQREVALKVLPRDRSTLAQELRLRREAQAAARLDDSGICPIYEIGHDGSHAFLAMRYVPGETLASRIERARAGQPPAAPAMPLPDLLLVFERLCQSLQRAHDAGIVHRDLKPGNLMLGADGQPVLLDFGLAVASESDGPLLTRSGDVFGTPAYLPPERLLGHARGDDRRCDIWALGVSLYEACTLQRPFAAPTLDALYRAILSDEAQPVHRIVRSLPRDLSAVVATCLEKSPERRYQSAVDLAADLRALRLGEPIRVRPPSPWRRLLRWHRRHAALATALWLVVLGLFAVIQVQRSMLEEVVAARDEANGLNEFLVDKLLLAVTPREARGRELTAAEIFDRATNNIARSFPTATRTAGTLHHVLGQAHQQLGRRDAAIAAFERAVAIRSKLFGPEDRATLQSRRELATTRMGKDQISLAERDLREILSISITKFGPLDRDVSACRKSLAEVLRRAGQHRAAEQELLVLLANRLQSETEDSPEVMTARQMLAKCLVEQSRAAEAEVIMRDLLERRRRIFGEDAIEVEQSLADLATLLHDRAAYEHIQEKWAEAEACYEQSQALATRIYPKTNPAYATMVNNVASFLLDLALRTKDADLKASRAARSEQLFRESLALREAQDGADSLRVANACNNLAGTLNAVGRNQEALDLNDRALAIRSKILGDNHHETIGALTNRGISRVQLAKHAEGLSDLREALRRARANPEISKVTCNVIEDSLIFSLNKAGVHEEALAIISESWPRTVAEHGEKHDHPRSLARAAAHALRKLGRLEEAGQWDSRAAPANKP
jgi:tetratricopeptide (TPR) repeat protein